MPRLAAWIIYLRLRNLFSQVLGVLVTDRSSRISLLELPESLLTQATHFSEPSCTQSVSVCVVAGVEGQGGGVGERYIGTSIPTLELSVWAAKAFCFFETLSLSPTSPSSLSTQKYPSQILFSRALNL